MTRLAAFPTNRSRIGCPAPLPFPSRLGCAGQVESAGSREIPDRPQGRIPDRIDCEHQQDSPGYTDQPIPLSNSSSPA